MDETTREKLVLDLHVARTQSQEAQLRQAEILNNARNSAEYKAQVTKRESADTLIEKIEQQLREEAVALYHETKSKKPHAVLGVRESTTLEYDEDKAIAYCRENMRGFIREVLLKDQFDKFAKIAVPPLPFVKIVTTYKGTISTDLGSYIAGKDEAK